LKEGKLRWNGDKEAIVQDGSSNAEVTNKSSEQQQTLVAREDETLRRLADILCNPSLDSSGEPPTSLTADSQGAATLVSAIACAAPDSGCSVSSVSNRDLTAYKRLAGVDLTLAATQTGAQTGTSGSPFSATQVTDERGIAKFTNVPPGPYAVTAGQFANYNAIGIFMSTPDPCQPTLDNLSQDNLSQGTSFQLGAAEQMIYAVFAPQPATITGVVYYDAKRNGDPSGQARINNVPVEFWQENVLVSSTTTGPPKTLGGQDTSAATGQSGSGDGCFQQQITRPGTIMIRPRPAITMTSGRKLQLGDNYPYMAQLDAGGNAFVAIGYRDQLADLRLVAYLEQETRGKIERVPLPDVDFLIYQGSSASANVYRQVKGNGSVPAVASGLQPNEYTIVAAAKSYLGQSIEPKFPVGGAVHYPLSAGQMSNNLEFIFRPCPAQVWGSVVDGCGVGVEGVGVTLTPTDQSCPPRTAFSDRSGHFSFPEVPRGTHVVSIPQARIRSSDSTAWEVSQTAKAGHTISVNGGGAIPVPALQLAPEVHKLSGSFSDMNGRPLAYLPVDIEGFNGDVVAKVLTDEHGKWEWIAPEPGTYYVCPQTPAGIPASKFSANVNPPFDLGNRRLPFPNGSDTPADTSTGTSTDTGTGPNHGGVRESVSDLQSFPVLTQDFSPAALPSASTPGSAAPVSGTSSLGLIADKAIREVLSWRTKNDDPKGFVGALNQAFALKDVEGHTEWSWTPRSYTVQTDMGAVTGAQASIYARAKVALDQSMPLLDGLYPLTPNVEPEDLATVQAVVRSQFTALVNEFGVVGGPRVPRVDELFDLLLSREVTKDRDRRPDPEYIPRAGSLGLVRERFGLQRKDVTTVEDEQNLTNYLILVDYVIGLWQSWNYYRDFFVRTFLGETEKRPFFGTQLVLMSRALEVVAQGVQDAYYTMDSVFIGDAERQTTQLDFAHLNTTGLFIPNGRGGREPLSIVDSKSGLFVAELLDWVYRAASEELPQLLQDAGKDGIESFKASTDRLRRFVHASRVPPQHAPALPPGYYTPRVQRSLQLLADGLDEAYGLAHQIRPPDLPVPFTDAEMGELRALLQRSGLGTRH
jgi:hypothetical protein